jgi:hypothetical protein
MNTETITPIVEEAAPVTEGASTQTVTGASAAAATHKDLPRSTRHVASAKRLLADIGFQLDEPLLIKLRKAQGEFEKLEQIIISNSRDAAVKEYKRRVSAGLDGSEVNIDAVETKQLLVKSYRASSSAAKAARQELLQKVHPLVTEALVAVIPHAIEEQTEREQSERDYAELLQVPFEASESLKAIGSLIARLEQARGEWWSSCSPKSALSHLVNL